jgi:hypothetical protein
MRMPSNLTFVDLVARKGEMSLSQDTQPAETTVGATTDEKEPVNVIPVDGVEALARYQKLKDATLKRLNERLKKSLAKAIERKEDMDIESHVSVFVESGLDYTDETAKAYINDWIKEHI